MNRKIRPGDELDDRDAIARNGSAISSAIGIINNAMIAQPTMSSKVSNVPATIIIRDMMGTSSAIRMR